MTCKDCFKTVLNFEKADRLPVIEWASWWDKTVEGWAACNPECPKDKHELFSYFSLDRHDQFWVSPRSDDCPRAKYHGAPIITSSQEYKNIKKYLFPEKNLRNLEKKLRDIKPMHDSGITAVWYSLEGFFWFPRTLLGIENHLYSYYDEPELITEINSDLSEYHKKTIELIYGILTPEFMTFAEDMSYNSGSMISKELFDKYMKPCYNELTPLIKRTGTKIFIDTDGQVEPLIPWFLECSLEGCLPLERMAGVDINRIRKNYPKWLMIGGFDKTVMKNGESAMRAEFERILPVIKSGGYIPSVDHQTPPDVSEENYRVYVRLLKEYTSFR